MYEYFMNIYKPIGHTHMHMYIQNTHSKKNREKIINKINTM